MLNDVFDVSAAWSTVPTLNKPNEEEFPQKINQKRYESNGLDKRVDE